ncbi:MAG: HAD family hydrolase [Selenomonadaceae bacterium]|nr:HAD family hydrolase [Selenomonadaceae bacterium]
MHYKGAIFDLDGTLVDSLADLADSANEMLRSYGFPEHELAAYRYMVGNGARKLIERCLPQNEGADEKFVTAALARYNECYAGRLLNKTKPYAGIVEMLVELKARGVKLGVCTNKQQFAAEAITQKLFPVGTFAACEGDKQGQPRKPDPTRALKMAQDFQAEPAQVAFVGDTAVDMETARRAGFLPVGVTWGFRPPSELTESGAQVLLESPAEIWDKVAFAHD